jgi:hypothetical protein
MRLMTLERARRRSVIAGVLALCVLAGCGGGSDGGEAAVAARPATTVVAAGPDGETDFTVVATLTEAPFFLTDDSRVGSTCGGDRGAGTVVESSRVDLFREGDELIEGLTGPGVVDRIELTDDGAIASMTCSFGVAIDLSVTDDDPYDLIFTTGRTADGVTLEMPAVRADALTGALELSR